MVTGTESLPESLGGFVSAAHWFQAGICLYHARKWKFAYPLLKKAHAERDKFRDASRVEIDRYFCLAATRMHKYTEAEACIKRMSADHRSKAIAAFLQADLHEYKREFSEAIREYERALGLNTDKDRRLEYIYRPLSRCILDSKYPDFAKAEGYAKAYVRLRQTVHSLMSRARVYLRWKYIGPQIGNDAPADIDRRYRDALDALVNHPGIGAAPFEVFAEEAEFTGDYPKALEHIDEALSAEQPPRFQLLTARWRIMVRSGRINWAEKSLRELDEARANPEHEAVWPAYIASLAQTYARALIICGRSTSQMSSFAPKLSGQEIGATINRVRREMSGGS